MLLLKLPLEKMGDSLKLNYTLKYMFLYLQIHKYFKV